MASDAQLPSNENDDGPYCPPAFRWTLLPPEHPERMKKVLAYINAGAQVGIGSLEWDTIKAALARCSIETSERRETGWLVEDGGHTPRYRTMHDGVPVWTDNPNEALRFARRVDAELFSREDEDAWRIVEHQWITLDGDQMHALKANSVGPQCNCQGEECHGIAAASAHGHICRKEQW